MNDTNQNNEPLKDLMKHHQVTSAPDDFTDNVMSMIESNVILEEDTKPIISKNLIYAVAAVFVILFGLSFVVDLSLFNVQGLRETISSGEIQGIFASFLQVANYVTAIFKEISSNNLFLIIPAAIGSLIALDNLLKKKPRHGLAMI